MRANDEDSSPPIRLLYDLPGPALHHLAQPVMRRVGIAVGEGKGGTNVEYLENTIKHLDEMGIPEGPLHRLRDRVRKLTVS